MLTDLLTEARQRHDGGLFLVDGEERLSYRRFVEGVWGLARGFGEAGIGRGDAVGVVLPNGREALATWLALGHLGAVSVPLHPGLAPRRRRALLERVGARGLVSGAAGLEELGRLGLDLPVRVSVGPDRVEGAVPFERLATRADAPPEVALPPDAPSSVLFTSGTTGTSKAVVLSQRGYVLPAREFRRWMGVSSGDRFLGCLPLFHLAGQAFALAALATGASLVLVERFSGSRFWDQVRSHRITLVRYLGEMLTVLLQRPRRPDDRHHTLRAAYGGGARRPVAAEFEERFGTEVVEGYGLTETNTVLCNRRGRIKVGIGRPLPYCEVRIADADGRELPANREGEIQVRSNPVMMLGYLEGRAGGEIEPPGEWFATGDRGYRDAEGYFHFAGREKDLIRRRGENVVPAQVEAVLERHLGVAEAAVVGVPDRYGGEEIKAFLVEEPDVRIDLPELLARCREELAVFEVPRFFELCRELPRTSTNKVNKHELRRRVSLGGRVWGWSSNGSRRRGGRSVGFGPGSLEARLRTLQGLADELEERRDELIREIVRASRKTVGVAAGEVDLAVRRLRGFGSLLPRLESRAPRGTVAVMFPGNASLSNPVATLGSAYLAGNRLLARFPGSARPWAEVVEPLLSRHLPDLVFERRQGKAFLDSVLSDPEVGVVMAFGDDAWARDYEERVRATRTTFIFEGPGKDPFLVLPGADVERAAGDAVRGAFYNSGQACTSPERFYVHEDLAEDFVGRVIELARREVVGQPEEPEVTIGPVMSRRVVERIEGQLADARERGARVLLGGEIEEGPLSDGTPATWVRPTVLTGVDETMEVMRSETFGPVVAVQTVSDSDTGLRLASSHHYGLAANLYGAGPPEAAALGATHGSVFRDEIWMDYYGRELHAPYGGRKLSGWVWAWEEERFIRRDGPRTNVVEFSQELT